MFRPAESRVGCYCCRINLFTSWVARVSAKLSERAFRNRFFVEIQGEVEKQHCIAELEDALVKSQNRSETIAIVPIP
jgi:hypothetical protein